MNDEKQISEISIRKYLKKHESKDSRIMLRIKTIKLNELLNSVVKRSNMSLGL